MSTNKLAIAGLMTSVTCIFGPLCIAIPISPVPISLGLFGILLTTCLLGAQLGTLSCALYLLLGFVGLPVFSGFIPWFKDKADHQTAEYRGGDAAGAGLQPAGEDA